MFPYYKGAQHNLQLDYDDILAMYQLYSKIRPRFCHRLFCNVQLLFVSFFLPVSRHIANGDDQDADESTTRQTISTTPTSRPEAEPESGSIRTTLPTTTAAAAATTTTVSTTQMSADNATDDCEPESTTSPTSTITTTDRGWSLPTKPAAAMTTTTTTTTATSWSTLTSTAHPTTTRTDASERTAADEDDQDVTQSSLTINYHGDYESVEEHRRRLNQTTATADQPDRSDKKTDICDGSIDAVSVLRNELFVFKDQVRRSSDRSRLRSF